MNMSIAVRCLGKLGSLNLIILIFIGHKSVEAPFQFLLLLVKVNYIQLAV